MAHDRLSPILQGVGMFLAGKQSFCWRSFRLLFSKAAKYPGTNVNRLILHTIFHQPSLSLFTSSPSGVRHGISDIELPDFRPLIAMIGWGQSMTSALSATPPKYSPQASIGSIGT